MFIYSIDSNKVRGLRRQKLREEKGKLLEAIEAYNRQAPEDRQVNREEVVSRLSVTGDHGADSLIWPWEVHSGGMELFTATCCLCRTSKSWYEYFIYYRLHNGLVCFFLYDFRAVINQHKKKNI